MVLEEYNDDHDVMMLGTIDANRIANRINS
jgi:hypothetical protein